MYRRVQRLGIQGKYEMNEEFRLRVKMLSALAFLPQEDISRAFEELSPQFGGAEMELLQYFDRTYFGYTIGNVRRGPLFEVEIRRVGGRGGCWDNEGEQRSWGVPSRLLVGVGRGR